MKYSHINPSIFLPFFSAVGNEAAVNEKSKERKGNEHRDKPRQNSANRVRAILNDEDGEKSQRTTHGKVGKNNEKQIRVRRVTTNHCNYEN